MTTITIPLDLQTADWLNREAATANKSPAEFVAELLLELADPDHVEGDLIDRLLVEATGYLPPIMTLDEVDEMREEILDGLCHRLVEAHRNILGEPMSLADQATFRERLEKRSKTVWF